MISDPWKSLTGFLKDKTVKDVYRFIIVISIILFGFFRIFDIAPKLYEHWEAMDKAESEHQAKLDSIRIASYVADSVIQVARFEAMNSNFNVIQIISQLEQRVQPDRIFVMLLRSNSPVYSSGKLDTLNSYFAYLVYESKKSDSLNSMWEDWRGRWIPPGMKSFYYEVKQESNNYQSAMYVANVDTDKNLGRYLTNQYLKNYQIETNISVYLGREKFRDQYYYMSMTWAGGRKKESDILQAKRLAENAAIRIAEEMNLQQ